MNNKLFDDFIKEKLRDQTAAVPADMWDRILRDKSNDRKSFFWWETLGSVIVLICLAGYFGWFGPLDNASVQSKEPVSIVGAKPGKHLQNSNPIISSSQPNKNAIPGIANRSLPGISSVENEKKSAVDNNTVQPSANNNFFQNNSGVVTKSDRHNSISNSKGRNIYSSKLPGKTTSLIPATSLVPEHQFSISDHDGSWLRPQYDRLSVMAAMQKTPFLSTAQALSSMLKPMNFSSVDCPSDRRMGTHGFYAEFFGSPDIGFKKMQYRSTVNNNYANRNDSTATKQLSYTIGMRLVKEIGQNMIFKTGLQYSQINERFDYRNENERTTNTVVTIRTITNSNGTTTTIRDTSIVEQVGYRVKTTYNHYRSWDVPVLLGFEFSRESWKADITGGAIFNLSSSQEGSFLDTSSKPSSFAKSGPAIFKRKLGVSLYGGLSFIKNISESTAFFAEPYLRYSLSDRTTTSSPFTSRFHTAGVLLGIRFKLNRSGAAK